MAASGLLTILVAIAMTGWVHSEGDYFVVCPNLIRPDSPFECEVSYVGTETFIRAEISLLQKGETPMVTKLETLDSGYKSISLQVPSDVPDGTFQVQVTGRNQAGKTIFSNNTVVSTRKENSLIFVQTDKPMYKPLETIRFRILCVDQELKPKNVPTNITLIDKNDNRLEQWLLKEGTNGVIEDTYQLSDLPPLGKYKLKVENMYASLNKEFAVEKYVLPKFDVKVETVPEIIIDKETEMLEVKVTSMYTYGKPVQGKVKFIFGDDFRGYKTIEAEIKANINGTHSQMIKTDDISGFKNYLGVKLLVNVTEESTDITLSSEEVTIRWINDKIQMQFLPKSHGTYRLGLPFTVYLKVTDLVTGGPAHADATVILSADFLKEETVSEVINSDGMVEATFDVPSNFKQSHWRNGISISAKLRKKGERDSYYYASWFVSEYRAKLNTTLTVQVPTSQPIRSNGAFTVEIQATGTLDQVAYMVLARGMIVERGSVAMSGLSTDIVINANRMMAPSAKVFVYGIVSKGNEKEVIADAEDISVSGVFENEVSLKFSKSEARPGSSIDITVKSAVNSEYFILALDKSVLLMDTGNDLTQSDVINGIRKFDPGMTPTYNDGPEPHPMGRVMGDMIMPSPSGSSDEPSSAGELLKKVGVVFLSNLIIEEKENFDLRPVFGMGAVDEMAMAGPAENSGPAPQPPTAPETPQFAAVGKVRKNFPEAWLWESGVLRNSGSYKFRKEVPDTISEFVATAFAMNDQVGLAVTTSSEDLRVFKPFFVSLALPYAIIKGEEFVLRVPLSNYLNRSTNVMVTLLESDDFRVIKRNDVTGKMMEVKENVTTTVRVEPNFPAGATFNISMKKLGHIKVKVIAAPEASTGELADNLERVVLVKPEGLLQVRSEGVPIELTKEDNMLTKTVELKNSDEYVAGSRRVEVEACGDVMGKVLKNLDNLVSMPTGCGEQNMIGFVPNIVVRNYLVAVKRTDPDLVTLTNKYMKIGYQRELFYKRESGSFSAFGDSDKSGSTWLTAFVIKSFSQAREWITVDGTMMETAIGWLLEQQDEYGGIEAVGRVIHTEMMGGSAGGKALTAFVYIAIKESESYLSPKQVLDLKRTQKYLENLYKDGNLRGDYELAIAAYALSLANSSFADQIMQDIGRIDKPWEKKKEDPKPQPVDKARPALFDHRKRKPKATDIEIWSYILLTYANRRNLKGGNDVMKWLLTQQNGRGGFSSTSDTVLALQALAEYAAFAYKSPKTDISLTVKANAASGSVSHVFPIREDKMLLLQSFVFPDDTTSLELTATGSGLAIVKVKWQYNLMTEPMVDNPKKIKGEITTSKINNNLYLARACMSSKDRNLGMAYMKMDLQTEMFLTNIEELQANPEIKRVDSNPRDVVVYFDEPRETPVCADFKVAKSEVSPISKLKPAAFQTVVYYDPEIFAETLYTVEESPVVDICKVCSGTSCPAKCTTSSATLWKYDGMLLAACICLLISLIVAV